MNTAAQPIIERPLLFSGEMVRATRERCKNQTRRVITPQPPAKCGYVINGSGSHALCYSLAQAIGPNTIWVPPTANSVDHRLPCPYGQPGDHLWVREAWRTRREWDHIKPSALPIGGLDELRDPEWCREQYITFAIDDGGAEKLHGKLRPSIFMPRWASRLTLQIENIRVEKIQDITEADAIAEGGVIQLGELGWDADLPMGVDQSPYATARSAFADRWDHLNAKRGFGWKPNPWVWVIEFKLL